MPLKATKKEFRVDWKKRDNEYCQKISELAKKLLASSEYPVRLTVTGLSKRLGLRHNVSKRPECIPKTIELLNEYAETHEEYIVRRIDYATQYFINNKKFTTKWVLLIKANVSKPHLYNHPLVKQKLDESVGILKKFKEKGLK